MITVARRIGESVRVRVGARGERTGGAISGRVGTVVDVAPESAVDVYFVRFDYRSLTIFFDWVRARDLC